MQENLSIDIKNQQSSGNDSMENANTKSVSAKIHFQPWVSFSKRDNFQKDSFDIAENQMRGMEDEINRLSGELKRIQDIGELEKKTNAQLEIQVAELKEKLLGKNVQSELEKNLEIAELNKKIKDLQSQLDDAEKSYKKKMEDSKSEQGDKLWRFNWKFSSFVCFLFTEKLNELLEKERQRLKKYEAQTHDIEASQKMIENLMERVATVEKEKAELAGQYEKYATLSDEVVNYKRRMTEMSSILEVKEKAIEKEKADKASIEHSQEDLLRKMKDLQKENDNLVVKLEGLKTENDGLITKNKKLEGRIKVLEDQNKQQLQQINDTLKMPVPITLDRETVQERSMKEVQKLEEFRHRSSPAIEVSGSRRVSNSSLQLSSSPPSLTIPTVNVSDEKRPASSEKDLKIIPKIVEPSTSTEASGKTKEKEYTSTINSQVAPTIPHDSPAQGSSKTFADTFSRSSKEFSLSFFRY